MCTVYGPLSPNMAGKHTLHLLEISEDQKLRASLCMGAKLLYKAVCPSLTQSFGQLRTQSLIHSSVTQGCNRIFVLTFTVFTSNIVYLCADFLSIFPSVRLPVSVFVCLIVCLSVPLFFNYFAPMKVCPC